MHRNLVQFLTSTALVLASSLLPWAARAQAPASDWPNKTVRIIVGFPAGSVTDAIARLMAQQASQTLGQPFVVENKPGANGMLGALEVARAAPDGYTLLVTNSSSITINPQIYKKAGYTADDFTPISQIIDAPFILVVNSAWSAQNNIHNVSELMGYAQTHPGQLSYGSAGQGNIAHLAWAMLGRQKQIDTVHVPYKSGSQAQMAAIGGEIQTLFDTPPAIPHIASGKLKALAVTAPARMTQLPDVPTMHEAGVSHFEISFWLGTLAPKGTPQAIIDKLYAVVQQMPENLQMRNALAMQGNPVLTDPASFARRIAQETGQWGEVIRREGIALN